MSTIKIGVSEVRQILIESFQAGHRSCFDFMEQEVERIIEKYSCLFYNQSARQLKYHEVDLEERLIDNVLCPNCSSIMRARISVRDLDTRSLTWECRQCDERVVFRLCATCMMVMEKKPILFKNALVPFDTNNWYRCRKCSLRD